LFRDAVRLNIDNFGPAVGSGSRELWVELSKRKPGSTIRLTYWFPSGWGYMPGHELTLLLK
jgi:hypothetical protein